MDDARRTASFTNCIIDGINLTAVSFAFGSTYPTKSSIKVLKSPAYSSGTPYSSGSAIMLAKLYRSKALVSCVLLYSSFSCCSPVFESTRPNLFIYSLELL